MPNNKAHISEYDLVGSPDTIPGPKWMRKLRVDAGTAAVITLDGAYRETLPPGGHMLIKYPLFRECKVYRVNTKDRQLRVETQGELIIQEPAPVPVDLTTMVTYRVAEPRVVALEFSTPLGNLYDFALEAMRDAVNRLHFEEFMQGGHAAEYILQHLQGRGLKEYLGIQVLNVQVSSLRPDEDVRKLLVQEQIGVRTELAEIQQEKVRHQWEQDQQLNQAMTQRDIAKLIELNPEYVALFLPDQYSEIVGDSTKIQTKRLKVLIEMAKNGIIPQDTLTRLNLADALGDAVGVLSSAPATSQLGSGGEPTRQASISADERIQQECSALIARAYDVVVKDEPGGYYYIIVNLNDYEEQDVRVYFVCTQDYPNHPPQVTIEVDGSEKEFRSTHSWHYKRTMLDILGEIEAFYGS
ncbi:MAG: SPFH domain-containing protein [Anaerolineae bacterium]|nr:SPFH domain-containing protein [Anaerolineae bacterium]